MENQKYNVKTIYFNPLLQEALIKSSKLPRFIIRRKLRKLNNLLAIKQY